MKRSEIKRKTPLKAKTPLKRTSFKKKPKRKKKTDLQKRIDKMDSPYWDKKCKAAVAEWAHMQACIITGKREPATRLVCGHHLIRKSRSVLYRWHPMNIIPLSEEAHLTSIVCAAHSDSPFAVTRFLDELQVKAASHYEWLVIHITALRKKDSRVGQIERPDWRYQYEIWRQRIRDTTIIQEL